MTYPPLNQNFIFTLFLINSDKFGIPQIFTPLIFTLDFSSISDLLPMKVLNCLMSGKHG